MVSRKPPIVRRPFPKDPLVSRRPKPLPDDPLLSSGEDDSSGLIDVLLIGGIVVLALLVSVAAMLIEAVL